MIWALMASFYHHSYECEKCAKVVERWKAIYEKDSREPKPSLSWCCEVGKDLILRARQDQPEFKEI